MWRRFQVKSEVRDDPSEDEENLDAKYPWFSKLFQECSAPAGYICSSVQFLIMPQSKFISSYIMVRPSRTCILFDYKCQRVPAAAAARRNLYENLMSLPSEEHSLLLKTYTGHAGKMKNPEPNWTKADLVWLSLLISHSAKAYQIRLNWKEKSQVMPPTIDVCRFRHDTNDKKVAEKTVRRALENPRHLWNFAETLTVQCAQEALRMIETQANGGENHFMTTSCQETYQMPWPFQLCREVKNDEHATVTMKPRFSRNATILLL